VKPGVEVVANADELEALLVCHGGVFEQLARLAAFLNSPVPELYCHLDFL